MKLVTFVPFVAMTLAQDETVTISVSTPEPPLSNTDIPVFDRYSGFESIK